MALLRLQIVTTSKIFVVKPVKQGLVWIHPDLQQVGIFPFSSKRTFKAAGKVKI
jgi:hypothetical protein